VLPDTNAEGFLEFWVAATFSGNHAMWMPFGDHPYLFWNDTQKISMAACSRMTRTNREVLHFD